MTKYHRFGVDDYRVESQETAFQGFFRITRMVVSHRLFGGGWSAPLKRELFQRGDAVGVLLYDPKHHTVGLVEQFRVGAMQDQQGPWQYEVVAGMIEPGESPADVATSKRTAFSATCTRRTLLQTTTTTPRFSRCCSGSTAAPTSSAVRLSTMAEPSRPPRVKLVSP